MTPLTQKLMIALDVDTRQQALSLTETLSPLDVSFKIGMQLFYSDGAPLIKALSDQGHTVFVDLKLHDIPNTVAGAIRSLIRQGASLLNVHAQGGPEMMRAAREATDKERPGVKLIAVTVLTSLSQEVLNQQLQVHGSVEAYVLHLARLAQDCGMDGVVCSPREAATIRQACGKEYLLITPGIRPANSDTADQVRIVTPGEALKAGSDYLVVGRPVTAAANPYEAARAILIEMEALCLSP